MESSKIERAASIARRIHSPVVVMDEVSDPVVVVPLDAYEEMIGIAPRKSLTRAHASATINRDIALESEAAYRPASGSGASLAEGADEQYYMEPLE